MFPLRPRYETQRQLRQATRPSRIVRATARLAKCAQQNKKSRSSSANAFTLVEMMMAMTITAMMSVVLGGLIMAVHAAWEHSNGLEESSLQGHAAIQRIKHMVSHVGVYQMPGQPTRLGLRVASHEWDAADLPDVLVVWSGGRSGGMADAGIQQRLPQINELVIYSPDPSDSSRLVEVMLPDDTSSIDFNDPNFNDTILTVIDSADSVRVLICDRIRQSDLPGAGAGDQDAKVGNIRFDLRLTPSDEELAAFNPGTDVWYELAWAQGIASGDSGMRQATVRMEFQMETRKNNTSENDSVATTIPFFGSASYRYVHQP